MQISGLFLQVTTLPSDVRCDPSQCLELSGLLQFSARGRSSPWQGSLSLSRTIVRLQVLLMIESERELLRPRDVSPAWQVELCLAFVALLSSCSVPCLLPSPCTTYVSGFFSATLIALMTPWDDVYQISLLSCGLGSLLVKFYLSRRRCDLPVFQMSEGYTTPRLITLVVSFLNPLTCDLITGGVACQAPCARVPSRCDGFV